MLEKQYSDMFLSVGNSYSVCLKDVSCLLVSELAAIDMVGVVCEVNLGAVVDTSIQFGILFFSQAHQLRTVLSGSPCASAYCFTDKYSIVAC